jgi:hypothetical protein
MNADLEREYQEQTGKKARVMLAISTSYVIWLEEKIVALRYRLEMAREARDAT